MGEIIIGRIANAYEVEPTGELTPINAETGKRIDMTEAINELLGHLQSNQEDAQKAYDKKRAECEAEGYASAETIEDMAYEEGTANAYEQAVRLVKIMLVKETK